MSRAGVTLLDVEQAALKLQGRGKNPSVDAIREVLGTGSKSTIAQHLRNWKAQQTEPQGKLPQDLLALVSGLWERLNLKAEKHINEIKEYCSHREFALKQSLKELQQNHVHLQKQLHQSEESQATLAMVKETLENNLRAQQQEHSRLIERDVVTHQQLESQKTGNARLHQLANNIQANLEQVPEETIRRRYKSGLKNFFNLYRPLTDS
jgi:chromosome segregation ATPase